MPKFMQEVKVEGLSVAPQFLNPIIKTEEITKVGTTGNRLTDIAFNSAIKYSQHMDELKRANELADLKINLNKELQDYELSWKEKDKYSEDNYNEYKLGLSSIYEKNKIAIAESKYTKESDVISWEDSTEQYKADSLFKVDGEKANYDIKKTTDESILKAESLISSYIATGDEDIKSQALNLFNGLSAVGIPQHEIDKMKIKTMVDADTKRLDVDINRIINDPNLSLQEKADRVKLLNASIESGATYEAYAKEAVDRGLISKDSADIFKNYSKSVYTDSFLKTGGIIQRLNDSIRDEQYQTEMKLENDRLRVENQMMREKEDVTSSFRNNNDIKAISILEGKSVDPSDLITKSTLAKKYYGDTPQTILDSGKYIPTLTSFEINDMKNKARIDLQNNLPRFDTISTVRDTLNNMDELEADNYKRELVANGVVSSFEVGILEGDLTPQRQTSRDVINFMQIGASNKNMNKLGGFVGLGVGSATKEINSRLAPIQNDFYKKEMLSDLVVGAMVSGQFGVVFDGTKGINSTSFRQAYNSNESFRNFVNESIELVNKSDSKKYKKATIKKQDIDNMIESKYKSKGVKIRKQTLETGVEPVVKEYYDFENF